MKCKTDKILVVVDMQTGFDASVEVIDEVTALVQRATKNNYRVIVLEYDNSGKTHREIRDALKGYDHRITLEKFEDSGYSNIADYLRANEIPVPKTFVFCGVNRSYCVLSTARATALYKSKARIELVMDCTADDYYWGDESTEDEAFKKRHRFKSNSRIKLVDAFRKKYPRSSI